MSILSDAHLAKSLQEIAGKVSDAGLVYVVAAIVKQLDERDQDRCCAPQTQAPTYKEKW